MQPRLIEQNPATQARADLRARLQAALDGGTAEIPMLPEVAARVLAVASRDDASAGQLARIITADPALAARVMRVACSAAYQPSTPIQSLQQAIAWLGMLEVADIAFSAAVQSRLLLVPGQRARIDELWQVAVSTALWSREIAALARQGGEQAYLCGLLHDIGRPVVLALVVDPAGGPERPTGADLDALQQGFAVRVGAAVADAWGLPRPVHACIRWHADPDAATHDVELVRIVHVARQIAELCCVQGAELARAALCDLPALDQLAIAPDRFNALLDRADWVLSQARAY